MAVEVQMQDGSAVTVEEGDGFHIDGNHLVVTEEERQRNHRNVAVFVAGTWKGARVKS